MKGKTVVITGGTSGIGEIAAERLAQMGARIVLIARDKSRGEAMRLLLPLPLQAPVPSPTANLDCGSSAMNEFWSVFRMSL
jgi:NAD(P)-dependent dehydrogenase (short-subunit alcohol dehydrogenase family)